MRGRDLLIVGLLSCVIGTGCQRTQAKTKDAAVDKVRVTETTEAEVTDYEYFIGHTDPMFEVDIRARVNGYLDKVCFEDGAEVEKGTLLFEIDPRQYQATYDQTVAAIEQGQARLTRTTADYRRADALIKRNAIGQEEYDRILGDYSETKAAIGSLKATFDMAKLNLDWTKVSTPISGRLSRRMVDPGNLVKADDTMLTTIVSLDPMYVNFDIDERTLLKLRRLVQSGRIKSRAEAEIPVLIGLVDEIKENGEPDFPHEGSINFSDNKLEASTGTLRLRALIANPKTGPSGSRLLSPGLFVRIQLPVGTPHKSIMIAERAILTEHGRKSVSVVEKRVVPKKDAETGKDSKSETREAFFAVRRDIKVGTLSNGSRVVDSGLKLEEKVIVDGLQRVRHGKEVELMNDVQKATAEKSPAALAASTPVGLPPTIAVADPISASSSLPAQAPPATK